MAPATPATISAQQFADMAGVNAGTVRTWARDGFPGAHQVEGPKGTPAWRFTKAEARRYADLVKRAHAIFPRRHIR